MRFLLLLVCVLGLAVSGCRKKSSPEFFKLEADQSILVARDGDEAYLSPEMAAIIAGLEAVPADTIEKDRATTLAGRLSAEKARVLNERTVAAEPKPAAADPFAGRLTASPSEQPAEETPPPQAAAYDAGEALVMPWSGIDEKLFTTRYGTCFSAGPATVLSNGSPARSQLLKDSVDCQKRYGTPGAITRYLFTEKGLTEKSTETSQVSDAGSITIPGRQPPTPDPGPPVLTLPGMPAPEDAKP